MIVFVFPFLDFFLRTLVILNLGLIGEIIRFMENLAPIFIPNFWKNFTFLRGMYITVNCIDFGSVYIIYITACINFL